MSWFFILKKLEELKEFSVSKGLESIKLNGTTLTLGSDLRLCSIGLIFYLKDKARAPSLKLRKLELSKSFIRSTKISKAHPSHENAVKIT